MFIGHFTVAMFLLELNEHIPVFPVLVGVSYPDLLWPILVYLKKEKVTINPKTPLQKAIEFESYPHSHSLVRSAILTLIPSALFAVVYNDILVGVFFFAAAMSHWLLDIFMHVPDLPILGFGADKKIGLGLWKHPKFAFFFEYAFFAAGVLLFTTSSLWAPLLIVGALLHALNANSFFGFTKANPTKTSNQYASLALVGFGLAIAAFSIILAR